MKEKVQDWNGKIRSIERTERNVLCTHVREERNRTWQKKSQKEEWKNTRKRISKTKEGLVRVEKKTYKNK